MAIKAVTATRMTMLGLKNQAVVAKRGHKLLKDKQDGLMQEFLKIVRRAKELRGTVEEAIRLSNAAFLEAQAIMPKSFLENALAIPTQTMSLETDTKVIMSVRIPEFKLKTKKHGNVSYGFTQTRSELDIAINKFAEVFELLIALAEIEKQAENMSLELEKTRRRVNALEYSLLPDLEDTLKFVKMKLDEVERSAIVQVMAIKAMIEKNEENEK
ncbi:V-type ATP synthase subunit D [bacterium DOLZORAL124_38_8]|nr:MAG: V-type ATP synthase subunit D [bacterium DOLZORAL124_38_8]